MSLIKITFKNKEYEVKTGTTIRELIGNTYLEYDKNPIVGATLLGELVSLSTPLVADGEIEIVPLFSRLGKRIYRHSLCFLFSYAVSTLFNRRRLVIGHSLGDGYFYSLKLSSEELEQVKHFMKKTVDENLPISVTPLSYKAAMEYFNRATTEQAEQLLKSRNDNYITTYKLKDYQDLSYEPLVDYTKVLSLWDIENYKDGVLVRYPQSVNFQKMQNFLDYPLLFSIFKDGHYKEHVLGIECVGDLNEVIARGEENQIIELEEALMNRNISEIAQKIHARKESKIVTIAGPSSSGKTTFSLKLCTQLQLLGYHCIKISLDDYYHTLDKIPLDKDGNKDFEALEALDLELIQTQLQTLLSGGEVYLPQFSFKENRRYFEEKGTKLKEKDLLVLEGIHGLNPKLLPQVSKDNLFKIYISALTSVNIDDHNRISTTDNRIIRRLVRDHRTRGTSATKTLAMWPSVEEGEKNHIFPFQNQADAMYNSAHTYELSALAPYAQSLLRSVKPEAEQSYTTARRLLQFLELFYPISAEEIPSNSLVREFIGGSIYKTT